MSKTQCITPIYHKEKGKKSYDVYPCGKCPACRSRRASSWSFRLMQEEKHAYSAYFITLTYAEKNVPRTRNNFMEIRRRDLQLFFKRLRKMQTSKRYCKKANVPYIEQPLKYFAVGEYGGRFKRPHYHAIMFNASAELIERAWKAGHVHYGDVSGPSVGYTMKYITKPTKIPVHRNDDRTPEFSLMSKGLGECYLSANMIYYHKKLNPNAIVADRCRVMCTDGSWIAMPRYYRDRLYSKEERKVISYYKKQDILRAELLKSADQLFNENETKKFKLYKIDYDKNIKEKQKQKMEDGIQCRGISKGLRKASRRIVNNTRSKHVSKNSPRKVHTRPAFA